MTNSNFCPNMIFGKLSYFTICILAGLIFWLFTPNSSKATETPVTTLEAKCKTNNYEACFKAGEHYLYGKDVPTNLGKAIVYFKTSCEGNYGLACSHLGEMYEKGFAMAQDLQQSANFYSKACNLNIPIGCYNTGLHYISGRFFAKDVAKGAQLMQKACEMKYAISCFSLGRLYSNDTHLKVNPELANKNYILSCNMGIGRGCFNAASYCGENQKCSYEYISKSLPLFQN